MSENLSAKISARKSNLSIDKIDDAIECALEKIDMLLDSFTHKFPGTFTENNVYQFRKPSNEDETVETFAEGDNFGWTTGFWTGMLWLAYELTQNNKYKQAAEVHVRSFENRIDNKLDVDTHDLGFLYTLSSTAAYKLTQNKQAKDISLKAADYLLHRYLQPAKIIQAHGDLNDPAYRGKTIIDCLLNLPLLYWATEQTGDQKYAQAAYNHAVTTMTYFIRDDSSTFHTYYFNPETGEPKYGETLQGYSDDSAWARGQSWGIYGFTLSYLYTKDHRFLETAKKLANYFLLKTPEDFVVYWDLIFDDNSHEEKDSSASVIAACGLMELVKCLSNEQERKYYENAYRLIMESLIDNYSTKNDPESNALLKHGVFFKKQNRGVNEASLYGDYFYLEGLVRAKKQWGKYW